MIPISIVTLIEKYKSIETLESTEEWFANACKQHIVVDTYMLTNQHLYSLLRNEEELFAYLEELQPKNLSYAESVLFVAQYLDGMETNRDTIKTDIFTYDGNTIFTYYLQWRWFRKYIGKTLPEVKKYISKTCKSLRWIFEYLPRIKRRAVITDMSDFTEWYLYNFFTGYPSQYCDIILFVSCCSSYYDFHLLTDYNHEPSEDKLKERGAIYEAIKHGKLQNLVNISVSLAYAILKTAIHYTPERLVNVLKLVRTVDVEPEVYASFVLSDFLNYKSDFLEALVQVFDSKRVNDIFSKVPSMFGKLPAGFGKDSLNGIRRLLLSLQKLHLASFHEFSSVLLTSYFQFIDQHNDLLADLVADGLLEWIDDLQEHGILIENSYSCQAGVCSP